MTRLSHLINDPGARNSGIFRATRKDGKEVLVKLQDSPLDPDELEIHAELARAGYAPQLHGILNHQETMELGSRFGFRARVNTTSVFMDEIKGAWDTHSPIAPPPEILQHWDFGSIVKQMREITDYLNKNLISAPDLQFLISPEGKVFIFDFDDVSRVPAEMAGFVKDVNDGELEDTINILRRVFSGNN